MTGPMRILQIMPATDWWAVCCVASLNYWYVQPIVAWGLCEMIGAASMLDQFIAPLDETGRDISARHLVGCYRSATPPYLGPGNSQGSYLPHERAAIEAPEDWFRR